MKKTTGSLRKGHLKKKSITMGDCHKEHTGIVETRKETGSLSVIRKIKEWNRWNETWNWHQIQIAKGTLKSLEREEHSLPWEICKESGIVGRKSMGDSSRSYRIKKLDNGSGERLKETRRKPKLQEVQTT
jgi:hypothetical protein